MSKKEGGKRHFFLTEKGKKEHFSAPPRRVDQPPIPGRNRSKHGVFLLSEVQSLKTAQAQAIEKQKEAGVEDGFGLQVEFEGFPNIDLAFESLEKESSGIELRNVQKRGEKIFATVFVPDGRFDILEKKITAYLDESKDSGRGPRNSPLLNTIQAIRTATLQSLWTDSADVIPTSDDEVFWWEVWLPITRAQKKGVEQFRKLAVSVGFKVADEELVFPERVVLLLYGSAFQMKQSMLVLNSIAELRRAKETADFFDGLKPEEQEEWVEDLNRRLRLPSPEQNVPYVCLLDTGVNYGHPLLARALLSTDCHTVDPNWGVHDVHGHGTGMAGIALFGDLVSKVATAEEVVVEHRLESVKLIPGNGANGTDAKFHGYLTLEATSRAEVAAPKRKRVYSMAVTAKDNRDAGRPSAWSASIDALTADVANKGLNPQLFIISAGNIEDSGLWQEYPDSNSGDSIHDPAQSWNALTVGAMTELVDITERDAQGYTAIAPNGGLSPFSTTSHTWDSYWPLKPDVVFEGGNAAEDAIGACTMHSLSLLTTNADMADRLFTTSNATSAASAGVARMAAQLMKEYPEYWVETIRALIVHSAEWTVAMKRTYLPQRKPNKSDYMNLIRHCGYGVPDLGRARWSANNSLTLICQDRLQPFYSVGKKDIKYNKMNLHSLPWPLTELEALGETEVKMRVTLSYFIEPNPSSRGVVSRYRYESLGLRFEVKRSLESLQDFRSRINAKARDEGKYIPVGGNDPSWLVGSLARHRGSIHSDIWVGTAADLASRGVLAVYPSSGWWRSRPALKEYEREVRYSLLVSIEAPGVDVDLYTPIENLIEIENQIAIAEVVEI